MAVDTTTTYMGLELTSPIIASASPITGQADVLRRLEECGAAAAVLPSLFEEQIVHEEMATHALMEHYAGQSAESLSYLPSFAGYNTSAHHYLKTIAAAKRAVSMPIIASLNGATPGGWVRHAKRLEEAGADALELNIYFVPSDPSISGDAVERRYVQLVRAVKRELTIPLGVKIGPQFSSLPHFASQLDEAGADGLVLFNRYLEPEIDLEALRVEPNLSLSRRAELRQSLRWIGLLHGQLDCSLAATGGVHSGLDALCGFAAGANAVMVTSVLMRRGVEYLAEMLCELRDWLEEHNYASLRMLIGSMSRKHCSDPSAFERGNYMKALVSYLDEGARTNGDELSEELWQEVDGTSENAPNKDR